MNDKRPSKARYLFISRTAPYGSNRAQLSLDAAFAAAVFEQHVNYLFMDDGVYQLLANQDAEGIHSKTLGRILETLDLYGIENVLVLASSLEERQLRAEDLLLPVRLVDRPEAAALLEQCDCVVNL